MIYCSVLRNGKSKERAVNRVKKGEFIRCEGSNIVQNIDVKKNV